MKAEDGNRESGKAEESLISLAHDMAKGSNLLIEQEIMILRAEWLQEWKKTKRALPFLFLAGVATVTVSFLTSLALAQWLTVHGDISLWTAYSVVALVGMAVGIILFAIGNMRMNSISLWPKVALESFKENFQCLTK